MNLQFNTMRITIRLMRTGIKLMGQSKSMRYMIDAIQPEQRHSSATG